MLVSHPSLLRGFLLVILACACVATPAFAAGGTCGMRCDAGGELELDVGELGGAVGVRFTAMEMRLAALHGNHLSPSASNCTSAAHCPCYPVNPCAEGDMCVAFGTGTNDYNCGNLPHFSSSSSLGAHMRAVTRDVHQEVTRNYGSNNYRLGRAVAFNYDGSVLAAARYRRDAGSTGGAVEMFERVNGTYTYRYAFYGSGVTLNEFGHNLQFSQDGTTLVAGSLHDGSDATGSVDVFYSATGKGHTYQTTLVNPVNGTHFGWFKNTVALSGDGDVLAVGCPYCEGENTTTGAVLVYQRAPSNGSHALSQTVVPRDDVVQQDSQLGFTVSMDSAGSTLVYAVRNPADPLQKLGVMVRATTSSDFAFAYSVDPAADPRNLRMQPSGLHFLLADFDGNVQVFERETAADTFVKKQTIGFGSSINFGVDGATSATGATVFGANLATIHSATSGTAYVIAQDSQGNFFAQGQYSPLAIAEDGYGVSPAANGAYAVGISGDGMVVGTGSDGVYGPSGWTYGKLDVYTAV